MGYYNSVSTPRIYVDTLLWHKSLGIAIPDAGEDVFHLNPTKQNTYTWRDSGGNKGKKWLSIRYDNPVNFGAIDYVAFLGHRAASAPSGTSDTGYKMSFKYQLDGVGSSETLSDDFKITEIVNLSDDIEADYDGFTIGKVTTEDDGSTLGSFSNIERILLGIHAKDAGSDSESGDMPFTFSCASIGRIYDFPHSPDLKLSISYETGTKTIETRGGASLSNTMWRPPKWGNLSAWELDHPGTAIIEQGFAYQSRRTWDLTFSFLSKENTFPKYNALNRLANPDLSNTDLYGDDPTTTDVETGYRTEEETLLDSSDFYSQVWNKVGTALPFIFQPDNTEPFFSICKIDAKSVKFTQVAHQKYTCRLRLKEIW